MATRSALLSVSFFFFHAVAAAAAAAAAGVIEQGRSMNSKDNNKKRLLIVCYAQIWNSSLRLSDKNCLRSSIHIYTFLLCCYQLSMRYSMYSGAYE
jgi:hypothetical protein